MTNETTLTGSVIKKLIALGSKSEREAVLLVVGDKEYILRQKGGNPLNDPELNELVGKRVVGDGFLLGTTFVLTDWDLAD